MTRVLGLVLALSSAVACSREPNGSAPVRSEPAAPQARPEGAAWLLSGTNDDRFTRVAKHLRGFDVAMVETEMLEGALASIEDAITAGDAARFAERFDALTATCNACHHAEWVPFVQLRPPTVRISPTGPVAVEGGGR
jgi:hypothetical protein